MTYWQELLLTLQLIAAILGVIALAGGVLAVCAVRRNRLLSKRKDPLKGLNVKVITPQAPPGFKDRAAIVQQILGMDFFKDAYRGDKKSGSVDLSGLPQNQLEDRMKNFAEGMK